jgi:mannose-6-phosphate isomerase-like protein (cupin superfamily)
MDPFDFHRGLRESKIELDANDKPFLRLFEHGSLEVELYQPEGKDLQQPHSRDEVYIIVKGSGIFFCNGTRQNIRTGDFLFVPAGIEHRFEDFTNDFLCWVLFYGPEGGE